MNPLQEYIAIIHQRQQNPLPEGQYGERHHIIPRSCGGPNRKWNVVRLTPEEHLVVHSLLPEIYTTGKEHYKMVVAYAMMSGKLDGEELTPERYSKLREEYSKSESGEGNPFWGKKHTEEWLKRASEINSGEGNPQYGKPHSEEHKRKIRESSIGKKHNIGEEGRLNIYLAHKGIPRKEETKRKLREWHLGRHNSEESKAKNSAYSSRSRWFHNEEKSFFIPPDDPKVKELNLVPGRLTFKRRTA